MLSPCSHGWLHTGCVTSHSSPPPVLAFSSHPSWHTQDDATLGSTSWPSQHMSCTSPRGPIYSAACSNMNRPQASRRDSGGDNGCRSRRATSILRGGSGSGEGDGGDNGEGSTRSQVQTSETRTTQSAPPQLPRSAAAAATTSPTNAGVALVTERSTATGGRKGLVTYSLLCDGSLRVGRRDVGVNGQRRGPARFTAGSPWETQCTPAALATAAVTACDGMAGPVGQPALQQQEQQPQQRAENVVQALRRRGKSLHAGAGAVAKGVAYEASAVAAGAKRCATGAAVAVRGGLMNTFLPVGYPESVRPEYLRYRGWDIIQDLSSHLRGVLATQAVLEGMGVGRAGSTPLAATLQWMARDGASMIGGLLFTSAASANFGVNIKTWRLFADASNDVGLALEMLAPLSAFREGGRFLRLICLASVFKAACGVAGGATGAAITEHWAVDNNIADVGAKNGAQHTVASLVGLGLSVWFARAVSESGSASGMRVWGWYAVLTAVHLLANYAAMRTLALRSVNPARASLLVGEYLQQAQTRGPNPNRGEAGTQTGAAGTDWMGRDLDLRGIDVTVLSPARAARREKIFMLPVWLRALRPWGDFLQINVGTPVRSLVREADDLLWLTSLYHEEKAMIHADVSYQPLGPRMGTVVNIALREDASPEDRLRAMFQANLIHGLLIRNPDKIPQGGDPVDRTLFLRRITEEALAVTRMEFPAFRKALVREGWDLSRVTLGGGPWVGRWGSLAVSEQE